VACVLEYVGGFIQLVHYSSAAEMPHGVTHADWVQGKAASQEQWCSVRHDTVDVGLQHWLHSRSPVMHPVQNQADPVAKADSD
jgi:predicted 2-oxoglutarate/Fe(II)-dependent dioxygenase YbiX